MAELLNEIDGMPILNSFIIQRAKKKADGNGLCFIILNITYP